MERLLSFSLGHQQLFLHYLEAWIVRQLNSSHRSWERVGSHLGSLLIRRSSGQWSKVDSSSGSLQQAIVGYLSQTEEITSAVHYQNYWESQTRTSQPDCHECNRDLACSIPSVSLHPKCLLYYHTEADPVLLGRSTGDDWVGRLAPWT